MTTPAPIKGVEACLTVREAAVLERVSYERMRDLCASGAVRTIKHGKTARTWTVPPSALVEFRRNRATRFNYGTRGG